MTVFVLDTLSDLASYIESVPGTVNKAARMAINQVAERKGVPLARKEIAAQVNFPKGYLNEDRLAVTRRANDGNLEAAITGRARPTSLARFAPGQTRENTKKGGVKVAVKAGMPRELQGAFLINLRNGNTGLAVRLKPGQSMRNSRGAVKMNAADNLYLLYGPSVDQVFRGVAPAVAPKLADEVGAEFGRQFDRLNKE